MIFPFDEAPRWFVNYFTGSRAFDEFHATIKYENNHDFVKDRAVSFFKSDKFNLYLYKDKIYVTLDENDHYWLLEILRN